MLKCMIRWRKFEDNKGTGTGFQLQSPPSTGCCCKRNVLYDWIILQESQESNQKREGRKTYRWSLLQV